jgi:hypothetical protein
MSAIIDCPSCRRKVRLPEPLAGQQVRCPTCGSAFEAVLPDTPSGSGEAPVATVSELPATAPQRRTDREADMEPCPYCGKRVPLEADYCPQCHADFDEEDDRPWEQPGGIRRDSEPHRGGLVLTLGIVSLVCAPLTLCCGVIGAIFSVAGLSVGITAWVLAQRDLKKMRANLMDPQGQGTTEGGRVCGIIGTILCSFGLLLAIALGAFYSFILFGRPWIAPAPSPGPTPGPVPAPAPRPARKVFVQMATPLRLQDYLPQNFLCANGAAKALHQP